MRYVEYLRNFEYVENVYAYKVKKSTKKQNKCINKTVTFYPSIFPFQFFIDKQKRKQKQKKLALVV